MLVDRLKREKEREQEGTEVEKTYIHSDTLVIQKLHKYMQN